MLTTPENRSFVCTISQMELNILTNLGSTQRLRKSEKRKNNSIHIQTDQVINHLAYGVTENSTHTHIHEHAYQTSESNKENQKKNPRKKENFLIRLKGKSEAANLI